MSNVEQISRRDFTLNPSKYLNTPGKYRLSGRKPIIINVEHYVEQHPKDVEQHTNVEHTNQSNVEQTKSVNNHSKNVEHYGCGCKKVDGNIMCSKHSRY